MKIFSAGQIRDCDQHTIRTAAMKSVDLMEHATTQCTNWLREAMPKDALFIVLCGTGNNGGDGLAITRLLHQQGFGVKAFLLRYSEEMSDDCRINLERLQQINPALVATLSPGTFLSDIPQHIIIMDALLGTGLNKPVAGWLASFIEKINQLPNLKIAVDIPSGLPADSLPGEEATILQADHTLSFQFYKRSFLHPEGGRFAGTIHLLNIGLDKDFIRDTQTSYKVIDTTVIRSCYQRRKAFTHKGTFGCAFLIGGSYGMMGAICLSAHAAYRCGAGKVKALIPACGYEIFQETIPEAMCITSGDTMIQHFKGWEDAQAIGIGPGLGVSEKTGQAFEAFLDGCKKPLVLDADALNLISRKNELLHKIPPGSILTPHPLEFERLFGKTDNSMARLELARAQAMRYNITIVLKDRYSIVVTPEGDCWYNVTGNAGLATGGTGDVLTGMITGLYAQGYTPATAAMLGVYLHGLAADLALEDESMESMMAGDLPRYLGRAFRTL